MKKVIPQPLLHIYFVILSLLVKNSLSDPRSTTVEVKCSTQLQHNKTVSRPNFISGMSNVSARVQAKGFGQAVVGTGLDASYIYAQCYRDLTLLDCLLCFTQVQILSSQCFPYNGVRIYLNGCFLRAQNYDFFGEILGPEDKTICGNSTRKGESFKETTRKAILDTTNAALTNGGYGKAEVKVSDSRNVSVYVLVDCWKILSSTACKACLDNASASIISCLPWSEGRAIYTGCFMRYSDIDFLNKEQQNEGLKGSPIVVVIAVVSSLSVLGISVAIGVHIWKAKRIEKRRQGSDPMRKMVKILGKSSLNFKYSTLEKATGSFADANKIGQGGFGKVYKGVLVDGREIAVKRLFFDNRHRAADFYNEVTIISRVEHKNLVRLLGCCCSGSESLLVYEFLPNKSLDHFIFDSNRGRTLNWEKRFEIIFGTAEGLVYLHENTKIKIIHRDIKCSNILLDSKFRAKIADFGLARSFQEDKSHISTAIAGTLGYMAPEYVAHGHLTEKADVYSFGVLLLEIVTGKQNNRANTTDDQCLTASVWKKFQMGNVDQIIDPNLTLHNTGSGEDLKQEILRVVQVGLLCTQELPSLRPSMSTVLHMLSQKNASLPIPANPAFMNEITMELNSSCEYPTYPLNAKSTSSVATVSDRSFHPR